MSQTSSTQLIGLLGGFEPTRFGLAQRQVFPSGLPGTRLEKLELVTTAGETVRAFLSGPDRPWENCPAVIYAHAHGNRYDIGAAELFAGRPALLAPPYAQALAEIGFVALAIDMPCFGERHRETEPASAKRHLWSGTTLFGAMLEDLSGAIDVLSAIPGVDRMRLSAFGISMGATLAFWLGALDDRITKVAQLCCFADLATLVETGAHDLHGIYMMVPGLCSITSTGAIAGLVAPRPQLICVGLEDPLTPQAAYAKARRDVSRAYAAADAATALETLESANTGHVETPAMRAAVCAFLAHQVPRSTSGG